MSFWRNALLRTLVFSTAFFPLAGVGLFYAPQIEVSEYIPPPPDAPKTPDAPTQPPFDPNTFTEFHIRAQERRIPVLMYHDVVKKRGPKSVWFDCTTEEFEKHLAYLKEQGAEPISLLQLHKHLVHGDPVPEKAIVLTFDDNYQGFYDNAYPLLKKYQYPSAMFVHTNYVGDKKSDHPKMDWETLLLLDKEGLVTIGSHTLSHPDDMGLLPLDVQEKELTEARAILEEKLGHPVRYFAYPNGKGSKDTIALAQKVGYTMAFTIKNGPAEESPGILTVNRYIHTRIEKAWTECQDAVQNAPAAFVEMPLSTAPVELDLREFDGVKMALLRGGTPTTLHASGRLSVGEFVKQADGVAGINGTFFANARLIGTDNTLIGPSLSASDNVFQPEIAAERLPRLRNRPIVMWNANRLVIFPFHIDTMNVESPFRAVMSDATDMFLAGAWIVHNSTARKPEEITLYGASDAEDVRPRAFFGITADGKIIVGASITPVSTSKLGETAVLAGVQEAVLLDSGYSTSVVYDGKILAAGHSARRIPSRPVPHAIVLKGTLQPPTDETIAAKLAAARSALDVPKGDDEDTTIPRRRHRSRKE